MTDPAHYQDLVAPILAGRRWLICYDAARSATAFLKTLHALGAPRPLVLAGTEGTGEPIDPQLAEVVILSTRGNTIMQGIRAYAGALRRLPEWAAQRIEAWDPQGEAVVWGTGLETAFEILGRPSYGIRPEEWARLEDKTTIQEIWEAAGLATAPSEVVPADPGELSRAAARLDAGAGTVWVGDNLEGWHGGGEYLWVVADDSGAADAAAFLAAHCDSVRVMPWLEGVPCSIHAMVFPDAIAAFRPTEMLVFRTPGSNRLHYAGLANWWEPPSEDREYMRGAVRRVAAVLRHRVAYRGALGIDGVMTADGFRPTELNPRISPGLSIQGLHRDAALPLGALHRALVEGENLDYRPLDLERLALANAASHPQMRMMLATPRSTEVTSTVPVELVSGLVAVADRARAHGTLSYGPSAVGGMVMLRIDPSHAQRGRSAAPAAAAAAALADGLWDLGIGRLIPATPVR